MVWKSGQSGNAGGRPKAKPFRTALEMEIKAAGDDHQVLRAIARALIDEAKAGNMAAINAVADRLDGKPVQDTNLSIAEDDRPLAELSAAELTARTANALAQLESILSRNNIPEEAS